MLEDQSPDRIVYSPVDLKRWLAEPPTVDVARPKRCPCCDAPSQPFGQPLVIVGHGLRDRQQRGPLEPGGPPREVTILARRYRCRACAAVLLVVPRGVLFRRLFLGPAIAWALALFGVEYLSPVLVRERVSPWKTVGATAKAGWAQLRRWVAASHRRELFAAARAVPASSSRRVAEHVAMTLASLAPQWSSEEPVATRTWWGALQGG